MMACLVWLAGCGGRRQPVVAGQPMVREVAGGVTYREFPEGGPLSPNSEAHVLDADLAAGGIAIRVAAERPVTMGGRVYGDSYSVMEWCRRAGAIGGVNGGFFGVTDGGRKEVIGLLARDDEVVASGRIVRSPKDPDRRFVRCVFGVTSEGLPHIGWSVGVRGRAAMLTEYSTALNPTSQAFWKAASAVACGPRLLKDGKTCVTDGDERLVSPGMLRRTFIGYDLEGGKPRHLVLGIGTAMTFGDVAAFLKRYFRETHGTACAEAMCLDGGSSTQMAYRVPTGYQEARPALTTVPTAVLIMPKAR
jgi:hypothetical protein